jgi:hypothetical protein
VRGCGYSSSLGAAQSSLPEDAQRANKDVGDVTLKTFYGNLAQFSSSTSVDTIISGDASADLKNLLIRQQVASLVDEGYRIVGVYLTNQKANAAS